mgnify:FL=1
MPFDQIAYHKMWRQKNKEKVFAYREWYNQTYEGRKVKRIGQWIYMGLIETDEYTYEELYEAYLWCGHCECCDVELTSGNKDSTFKCMDHCHTTGIFRNILCNSCNVSRR